MKIIHFFKDIVCLTGFSFGCLCVVAFLLFVAFILILVGVIAHEPYKNNYVCFKSCHAFIAVMQVAWLVSLITLCIEFVVVLIYSFRGEFGPIKFFLRFFGTFLLIAGLVELAKRIYEHGGVGYVSPYEKLTRLQSLAFGRLIHRSLLIGLYCFESFFLLIFYIKNIIMSTMLLIKL